MVATNRETDCYAKQTGLTRIRFGLTKDMGFPLQDGTNASRNHQAAD